MINNVVLVGRITKDPELRTTSSNIASCSFTLAIDRQFQSQSGERQADFINCVAWRQSAEFMSRFIKKGYMMAVTGRLQSRSYQDQSGKTVYVTEVVCDSVQNLQPRDPNAQPYNGQAQSQSYQPRSNYQAPVQPEVNQQLDLNVDDTDLPF